MTAISVTPQAGTEQRRDLPPSMVERMTLILDVFEGRTARLTLEEVSRRTQLPRSTAHRILEQLVRLRWLQRTALGYSLGQRVLGFGDRDGSYADIRSVAAPLLQDLQLKTGMIVHLAVLDGAEVYYLDKVGGRFATMVPSRVGGRAPAHSTALGKALLAWLEPEQVDERVGAALGRLTHRTIADLGTLHQELHRIRRRHGLAFERGECFPGISCVAAAIRGPEAPVASLSLVGDRRAPLEKLAPLALDAARQAGRELFEPDAGGRSAAATPVPAQTWSPETMDRLLAVGRHGEWL
ncbi:MAG: IclR family transcriptional regulator [Streptosporangiales bacterium]